MKTLIILSFIFLTTFSFSKRKAPKKVLTVMHDGIIYVVNHWGKNTKYKQNGGIIEVREIKSYKLLDTVLIYKIDYNPKLEHDVQDVFIKKIKLNGKKDALIIINGKGYKYEMNLKTLNVIHVIGNRK